MSTRAQRRSTPPLFPICTGKKLTSTGSTSSISSTDSGGYSTKAAAGAIQLEARFLKPVAKKNGGVLEFNLHAAADLSPLQPYLKLYLTTETGITFKETKAKSRAQRREAVVRFDERLTVTIPKALAGSCDALRAQLMVWDKKSVKANAMIGGMSFSVGEIKGGAISKAWYKVLSTADGRETHKALGSHTFPAYSMARSESLASLMSVAQDTIRTADIVTGGLRVGIAFEPPAKNSLSRGTVVVHVGSGIGVSAKEPYIKMYLSVKNRDIKSTKVKSKVRRNRGRGKEEIRFNEALLLTVPQQVPIDGSARLQIMLWDHTRLSANECVGGFSIALPEVQTGELSAMNWYRLLPHPQGRSVHEAPAESVLRGWELDDFDEQAMTPQYPAIAAKSSLAGSPRNSNQWIPSPPDTRRSLNANLRSIESETRAGCASPDPIASDKTPLPPQSPLEDDVSTPLPPDEDQCDLVTTRSAMVMGFTEPTATADLDENEMLPAPPFEDFEEPCGKEDPLPPLREADLLSCDNMADVTRSAQFTACGADEYAVLAKHAAARQNMEDQHAAECVQLQREVDDAGISLLKAQEATVLAKATAEASKLNAEAARSTRLVALEREHAEAAQRAAADNKAVTDALSAKIVCLRAEEVDARATLTEVAETISELQETQVALEEEHEAALIAARETWPNRDAKVAEWEAQQAILREEVADAQVILLKTQNAVNTARKSLSEEESASQERAVARTSELKNVHDEAAEEAQREASMTTDRLQDEISAILSETSTFKVELATCHAKLEELMVLEHQCKAKHDSEIASLEALSAERDASIAEWTAKEEALNRELDSERAIHLEIQSSLLAARDALSAEAQAAAAAAETRAREVAERRAAEAEAEAQHTARLLELRVSVETARQEMTDLEYQKEAAEHALADVRAEREVICASLDEELASLAAGRELHTKAKMLSQNVETLQSEHDLLQDQLVQAKRAVATTSAAAAAEDAAKTAEVRTKTTEISAKRAAQATAATDHAAQAVALAQAKTELDALNVETARYAEEVADMQSKEAEVELLRTTVAQMHTEAEEARVDLAALRSVHEASTIALQTEREELLASLAQAKEATMARRTEYDELATTMEEGQAAISLLRESVSDATAAGAEATGAFAELQSKREEQLSAMASLTAHANTIRSAAAAIVETSPTAQPPMRRSMSESSLVSVAANNCFSSDNVTGMIRLSVHYVENKADPIGQHIGKIRVLVHQCYGLVAQKPLIKLYLSHNGQDMKLSKRKTKAVPGPNPRFDEKFEFPIASPAELDESYRVQISVWDHARVRANECSGGLSFSLLEVCNSTKMDDWFVLLPSDEGRGRHERAQTSSQQSLHIAMPVGSLLGSPVPTIASSDGTEWNTMMSSRLDDSDLDRCATSVTPTIETLTEMAPRVIQEHSEIESLLSDRTAELWALMETNAEHVQKLADVLEENVRMRHATLDTAGLRLRTAVIIKPQIGHIGLELNKDAHAQYKGVRISHVEKNGPADGGDVRSGDVIIAINGSLVLGMDFDSVIYAIADVGTVLVLSLASGKDVDAPGSAFWDDRVALMSPLVADNIVEMDE
mmetsp:Transcript_30694/g.92008  ORF Transcript_30694/g.92008 Transcript_30694/m.92008 type:complete len:1592 (-) Transcript_30694:229-5004(-)|eukprot:CAMPEP_0206301918 /NCGR_PEP_ID=MMETSP0106_2-20121207/8458_1 /ASSEMBLY_ACC=CAM_ASM_000206 /TAXON_ID=81532 /ORGANISM="Acanthoeca-like sp., Strain 10tr" /LENGTH=1591 /DNA_ID=CAMNT_0053732675 /DNA_START=120 /DNA_END=4895 /DNA_ORIENTATION=-